MVTSASILEVRIQGTCHLCPPHSNSSLVSFFSSFFQPRKVHEKTFKSLTSCPKSGKCLAANASSAWEETTSWCYQQASCRTHDRAQIQPRQSPLVAHHWFSRLERPWCRSMRVKYNTLSSCDQESGGKKLPTIAKMSSYNGEDVFWSKSPINDENTVHRISGRVKAVGQSRSDTAWSWSDSLATFGIRLIPAIIRTINILSWPLLFALVLVGPWSTFMRHILKRYKGER